MQWTRQVYILIGSLDALLLLCMGVYAAFGYLTRREDAFFWERILPATLILVATSIGAGVMLAATKWFVGA